MPNAVLAAVVFLIGIRLIDVTGHAAIARLRPGEFVVAVITAAVVVVVGVEQGIILAMVLSIVEHIDHTYHPRDRLLSITEDGRIATTPIATGTQAAPGLAIYRFGAGIYYANASRFTEEILELVEDASPSLRWLAVSMASVSDIDYSGSDTVARLVAGAPAQRRHPRARGRRRRRAQAARRLRPDRAHRRGPDLRLVPGRHRRLPPAAGRQ